MKRRIIFSIALVLSITLVSLTSSDRAVNAERSQRYIWDTGVVALGQDEELVLTVLGNTMANGTWDFRIRRMNYTQVVNNGGVWRLDVSSDTTTDPITLMPGEAVSILAASTLGRGIVSSNSRDLRVNATIKDTVTGEVVAFVTTDLVIDVSGYD
jgi:hypothetical protein